MTQFGKVQIKKIMSGKITKRVYCPPHYTVIRKEKAGYSVAACTTYVVICKFSIFTIFKFVVNLRSVIVNGYQNIGKKCIPISVPIICHNTILSYNPSYDRVGAWFLLRCQNACWNASYYNHENKLQ